jgi:hypothetical protein
MAASALIVSLLSYAVRLDLRGFIHCIVILLLTAVMCVYFAMFAPVVGLLAFAIFVALSAFGTIGSLRHYHVSPEEQRQQDYKEANEELDKALELGLTMTLKLLQEQGRDISPASQEALAYLQR